MSSKFFLLLLLGVLAVSPGCTTTPECATSTPGTVGTASGTSYGTLKPNNCPMPSTQPHTALVYSLDTSGSKLNAAAVNSSGSLAPLSSFTSPALPPNDAQSMLIVRKQFLYISMGDTNVEAFLIDHSTGALTAIEGSPFSVPTEKGATGPSTADPQGRFLFVGGKNTGEVWVFKIDATTGALSVVAGSPFTAQFTFSIAASLAVDASGKYLYVGQGDPNLGVIAFSIDPASGVLTQVHGAPFYLGVAQLGTDPVENFLFGIAQIQEHTARTAAQTNIYAFAITSDGIPTPLTKSPFTTTFAPHAFMIVPNGQIIYSFGVNTESGKQGIEGFQKNVGNGELAAMSSSPYQSLPSVYLCQSTQSGSLAVCIDDLPGSKFLLFRITFPSAIGHIGTDLQVERAYPFAVTE